MTGMLSAHLEPKNSSTTCGARTAVARKTGNAMSDANDVLL
jgi:hypothetical protein